MTESTQPTSFTRLRTTIVLVSMVVMPLCAVIGVKMPKFLSDKANESAGVTTAETKENDPKRKSATKLSGSAGMAGRDRSKEAPLATAVSLADAEAGNSTNPTGSPSGVVPVFTNPGVMNAVGPSSSIETAAHLTGSNTDVRDGGVSQAVALEALAAGKPPVGFDPSGSIQPLPPLEPSPTTPSHTASAPAATTTPPSGGSGSGDQFSSIQTRLKALGATHYTLETWGPSGNSYRFQCRMAAGHSADYTRQFEATDTDPLRTMQTVLDEVEAWKAGRLP